MKVRLQVMLFAAILGMATTVLATANVKFTEWGKSTAGLELSFKATGMCPTNGDNDALIVSIEIKDQTGAVVGSGSGAGTGKGPVGCQCPGRICAER